MGQEEDRKPAQQSAGYINLKVQGQVCWGFASSFSSSVCGFVRVLVFVPTLDSMASMMDVVDGIVMSGIMCAAESFLD